VKGRRERGKEKECGHTSRDTRPSNNLRTKRIKEIDVCAAGGGEGERFNEGGGGAGLSAVEV